MATSLHAKPYVKPAGIDHATWKKIEPYLLPEKHETRDVLDKIFAKGRPSASLETLSRAKFETKKHEQPNNIVVGKHRNLKGYVIKLYTDDQHLDELPLLIKRIDGANCIREVIARHRLEDRFKVPRKWLYPLPQSPVKAGDFPHRFILVADNMRLAGYNHSLEHWRGDRIPKKVFDGLFIILKEAGLYDSVIPTNIPFSLDGRVAFIDTEHWHWWPVPYHILGDFLSKKNRKYWQELIGRGAP